MSLACIHLHFFISFSDSFIHSFLTHIHCCVISSYIYVHVFVSLRREKKFILFFVYFSNKHREDFLSSIAESHHSNRSLRENTNINYINNSKFKIAILYNIYEFVKESNFNQNGIIFTYTPSGNGVPYIRLFD